MAGREQKQAVTVLDVARLAGVSAMTVSRVMNNPAIVTPSLVERVRDAAAKLGYVRNRVAGGLRSSRSHLVAAIVPTLSGPVFLDSIESLTAGLTRRGYHLMVGQTGYADPREDELLEDVISRRPDAIVLTGTMHSKEGKRLLLAAGVPVVEIWDLTPDPIDLLIGFSHEAVGTAVADYLIDKGRKRLALIGGDDGRSRRRIAAFEKRVRERGLPAAVTHLVHAPARLGDGRLALRELLARHRKIDAVFCSSDMLANGVLIEAAKAGLDVPKNLAVVGFGDQNFAVDLEPSLTTVRVDARRIGELAADVLVRRLQGETLPERAIDVGFSIERRESA